MINQKKIIICGGKTGGHIFPGIAIAQALIKKDKNIKILFVGTGELFETKIFNKYGFNHKKISAKGIKGKSFKKKFKSILNIPISIFQAIKIIKHFKSDFVIGVGGYSSGSVVLAAKLLGITTAIQEQNSIPGLTNKILARFVNVIFTSFKDTRGFSKKKNQIFTGNPLRKSTNTDITDFKLNPENFTILIIGGSQGAESINKAFLNAIKLIDKPEQYNVIHQTGKLDEKIVISKYKKTKINWHAKAFFYNMPILQNMADLIISRAGALTISEITLRGKPCILIPYPYAADDHQKFNANALVKKGGAWMILDKELSGEVLKEKIEFGKNNPDKLLNMGKAAKNLSMDNADEKIADTILKMIKKAN